MGYNNRHEFVSGLAAGAHGLGAAKFALRRFLPVLAGNDADGRGG